MSAVSDTDALDDTAAYYQAQNHQRWSTRTQSVSDKQLRGRPAFHEEEGGVGSFKPRRRLSHDPASSKPRKFLIDVESTLRLVLEQEDTDGNFQICITDAGPKVFALGTATSNGFKSFDIRGTWMLSVLLQELALAKDHGRTTIILDESRLSENPVTRLSRMIRTSFWDGLTRRIDADGLELICADPKNRSSNQSPRIYVPEDEPEMVEYYRKMAADKPHLKLDVAVLPRNFDAKYVKDVNHNPGILALAMKKVTFDDGTTDLKGIPFVVPGARFNELYDWDSYFISLGLIEDGRIELAKGIVDHFIFQIKHYGKVCNGSRSYYLMRSQPPFLTDLALQIYYHLDTTDPENKEWLKRAIRAAIKEYHTVWMSEPRFDPVTGLTRYRPDGLGVPPETEASHFTHILMPYAEKHGISVNEFVEQYNDGKVSEPELDVYFLHDRAVRESGHDTTYRFEKKCANLGTIDLNSLLFKYENDIATAIKEVFDDTLELEEEFELQPLSFGTEVPFDRDLPTSLQQLRISNEKRSSKAAPQTSAEWFARANRRKQLVDHYCWDAGQGLYFDYDCEAKKRLVYETCTALWVLYAGMASEEQASRLVHRGLAKFEVPGGVVSGSQASLGKVSLDHPNRQWDWPQIWPPHQVLAWMGLARYGFHAEAQRLAYRWTHTLTKAFVDYNGVIPEKFDGVKRSHFVTAEYGNQGIDFMHVPREGFGWTNASYNVGLSFLDEQHFRYLHVLADPDELYPFPA